MARIQGDHQRVRHLALRHQGIPADDLGTDMPLRPAKIWRAFQNN